MNGVNGFLASLSPGVAIWTAVLVFLGTVVTVWPKVKATQLTADGLLRGDLMARVVKLEADAANFETRLAEERDRHEAEIKIIRHRLNNETAALDALLLLLETSPDRVVESVRLIKEMRVRRAEAVAIENAALLAARLDIKNR